MLALESTVNLSTSDIDDLKLNICSYNPNRTEQQMKNQKRNKEQIISVANLICEFDDPVIQKRVNSVRSLRAIGNGLGKERIRSQLIPFLQAEILDDQNQVILALLQNIEVLGQLIGGGMGYTCLYGLLEEVLQNQEQKVRTLAVEKYARIMSLSELKKSENVAMQSIRRIMDLDYDQAKEAVVVVIARLLGEFSGQNQQLLVAIYSGMVEGNSQVLRKFASIYSQHLARWLSCSEPAILKIVDLLFKDKQQANKIYLVDTIIELAKHKPTTFLQPYFNMISYQFTWRVRYQLISKGELLGEALGPQNFKTFLSYILKYINDIEPEIRSISCLKLKEMIRFLQVDEVVSRVIPALKNVHQDSHVYVRNSFAESLLALCPIIGKKNTTEFILPKFLQLLKDEDQYVRITIFKHIDCICKVLGTETLSQSIMPAMAELATHQNWRVRVQSINIFLYFVNQSGIDFMNEKNIKMAMDYLRDKASSVRKEGLGLLLSILDILGNAWFQKNMLPKVMQLFKATSYLQRETALLAQQKLLPKLSSDATGKCTSAIIGSASDPVSNVRLCVCRVYQTLYPLVTREKEGIKKSIRNLKEDKDVDVREIAVSTEKKFI